MTPRPGLTPHAVRLPPEVERWAIERIRARDYYNWTDLLLMAVLHLREAVPTGRVGLKHGVPGRDRPRPSRATKRKGGRGR